MTPQSEGDREQQLGERLRSVRLVRGLSVREVARQAGITASFLSQVERNLAIPSLTSLRRVCDVLGISIVEALEDSGRGGSVVRADSRSRLATRNNAVELELLVEAPGRPFDLVLARLAPGAATADEPHTHPASECTFVMTGTAKFELGKAEEILNTGDSIFYSSQLPHRIINVGDEELVIISCISGRF